MGMAEGATHQSATPRVNSLRPLKFAFVVSVRRGSFRAGYGNSGRSSQPREGRTDGLKPRRQSVVLHIHAHDMQYRLAATSVRQPVARGARACQAAVPWIDEDRFFAGIRRSVGIELVGMTITGNQTPQPIHVQTTPLGIG